LSKSQYPNRNQDNTNYASKKEEQYNEENVRLELRIKDRFANSVVASNHFKMD